MWNLLFGNKRRNKLSENFGYVYIIWNYTSIENMELLRDLADRKSEYKSGFEDD